MRSDQWRDRLGPWLLPILALAALGISAGALYQLMVRFGWTEWQAALLPTCVDLLALYGVYLWLSNTHGGEAWRFGRKVAYAALIVSLAGNALEHGLSATGWYTAGTVLFGSVPPVALFVMVHAYFKVRTTRPKPKQPALERQPELPTLRPVQLDPATGVSRNPTPTRHVVTRKGSRPLPVPAPEAVEAFTEHMTRTGKPPTRKIWDETINQQWPKHNRYFQAVRTQSLAASNGHHA